MLPLESSEVSPMATILTVGRTGSLEEIRLLLLEERECVLEGQK